MTSLIRMALCHSLGSRLRTMASGKVAQAAACNFRISPVTMVKSLVVRSFSPKCNITSLTRGETGVLCLSRYRALETLAPGKQSTCIPGSWTNGSRLILEAPTIRTGQVGVRDQLSVLLPQWSCLQKRFVVARRW